MKTIYKYILVLGVGLFSMAVQAQKDSTLTRQVMLEREYNPTLNEATKINTAPNIYTPTVKYGDARFLDAAPQLAIGASKLGQVASGDIQTEVPFSKRRSYINFSAGSYGNLDGALGVRIVDAQNDKLDVYATHHSTSGNVNYANKGFAIDKVKAKSADTRINLNYEHAFAPSVLSVGAGYMNNGFNYYGNSFQSGAIDYIDLDTKQKIDAFSLKLGLKASELNEGVLKYRMGLGYTSFSTKYGYAPSINKGPRGGLINANMDLYTELGEGNIGFDITLLNESFNDQDVYSDIYKTYDSYTNVGINPYYKLEGLAWDVNLGLNVNYVFYTKNKFVVAPNILAQFHVNDINTLYAGITGGVNDNTYLDIIQENRYVNNVMRPTYSRTTYDAKVGFKSGIVPNLEFDVFAGYKQTKDDHLYAALLPIAGLTDPIWSNTSSLLNADVSTGHVGGLLKTKLIPNTTLSAKIIGYFYNVKNMSVEGDKAWGRPNYTIELNADVKPIDKLALSASYLLAGGRKALHNDGKSSIVSMKNINEFNVRAEYQILDFWSMNIRVNNLLNQKYELQHGYTLQGISVMGGFGLKF